MCVNIFLANPRGFCAGVTRAITTVENALLKFGRPIYVKHEIVHNKFVVNDLKNKGAIFVDEISEIPKDANVIFSAHGVSNKVETEAQNNNLKIIDATCPLVSKVHKAAQKYEENNYEIILIGHKNHPEVEGTKGRVKQDVLLVSDQEDAKKVQVQDPDKIAFVTQTTLSLDDTKGIIEILSQRFPKIEQRLYKKDICYATQNRQNAVRDLAKKSELILVIGSKNSSNSNRLRDLAIETGSKSYLIDNKSFIDKKWLKGVKNIGITAGASAPEILVEEVIEKLQELLNNNCKLHLMEGKKETIKFSLPDEVV
ncbi:4-hydroxy-3-methylbut-2-enyl diphosphate reductase [Rickettsiales bacterium]|nr:4-hydroxy-3-methylbut-2-enyl diphosphate reductase [Rickettsiales bacterium]